MNENDLSDEAAEGSVMEQEGLYRADVPSYIAGWRDCRRRVEANPWLIKQPSIEALLKAMFIGSFTEQELRNEATLILRDIDELTRRNEAK